MADLPRDAASATIPILGNESVEARVARERKRLLAEAGLDEESAHHFRRPVERPFTRDERARVTLLFGGLTICHERLVHAGLEGLGYRPARVPTPAKADFQAGKEYGNNGQCNPTYFTVGALVNYLKRLRDEEGVSTQEILDNYVFLTAGACGPCRFGMYEAEYRLALRNSGFDGFRVILFQQKGGLQQAEVEAGLEMNVNFFLTILNAIMMGDLVNEVAYQVRPYEVEPGATARALENIHGRLENVVRARDYDRIQSGLLARLLAHVTPFGDPRPVAWFLDQLRGDYYLAPLAECARVLDEAVEVDFTRPRPIVKVTGEFWAQTTEGDGNFRMFPFLESQGAEVLVEPVTTWINYLLTQSLQKLDDEHGLGSDGEAEAAGGRRASLLGRAKERMRFHRTRFQIHLAQRLLVREYDRMREALGGTTHEQADQFELSRAGHPYYNRKSQGGEGHLEVAKNIYYMNHHLAHMVLSLKPFGCMPSTQSDGAQAAVMSHFREMIYLPIETSGEGDVNAHSRVQMALGEAKTKCREEFQQCVARTGFRLDEIRAYVARHRELRRPLQRIPHHDGVVGRAANFILHVGRRMAAEAVA